MSRSTSTRCMRCHRLACVDALPDWLSLPSLCSLRGRHVLLEMEPLCSRAWHLGASQHCPADLPTHQLMASCPDWLSHVSWAHVSKGYAAHPAEGGWGHPSAHGSFCPGLLPLSTQRTFQMQLHAGLEAKRQVNGDDGCGVGCSPAVRVPRSWVSSRMGRRAQEVTGPLEPGTYGI